MYRETISIETKKTMDKVDITEKVQEIVEKSKVKDGICNVFLKATTAGLVINEKDLMLLKDFERFFSKIFPQDAIYVHADNGFSHLRASLCRTSASMPVEEGKLALGTWQSIMLWEFDARARKREIVVSVFSA